MAMKMRHSDRIAAWTVSLVVGIGLMVIAWPCVSSAQDEETAKPKEAAKSKSPAKAKKQAVEVNEPKWDDYTVILERNMFSKNRRAPHNPRDDRPVVTRPPANPESFYILRGVANENGVFKACLQDNQNGGVKWVYVGDEVARGKIKAIPNLDTIEFEMGETSRTVAMGYDLEGGRGKIDVAAVANWGRSGMGGDMRDRGPGGMRNDMMGGRNNRSRSDFNTRFNMRDRMGGMGGMGGMGMDRGMGMRGMGMGMDGMAPSPSASSSSSSDTTLSGNDAELLRRMMERRQSELGQGTAAPASDPNQ
jgi:hypothetical protein